MGGPLVGVGWLEGHLDEPRLRIADVRSLGGTVLNRFAYDAGHIAGAIFFDMESDLSADRGPGRHPLPTGEQFGAMLGDRGIGNEHTVVVYDDQGGAAGARLWWMLRHWGHSEVVVLDGGLHAWLRAGLPLTRDEPEFQSASFSPGPGRADTVDRDRLRDLLGRVVLVDARSGERYRGEQELLDPVAGHIPTARNAPFAENLGWDGRFRSPEELAEHYRRLDVAVGDEVVVYCGSGVTACHTLLALEVAGFEGARLYPGSWSDWGGAGYPMATGPEPGSP